MRSLESDVAMAAGAASWVFRDELNRIDACWRQGGVEAVRRAVGLCDELLRSGKLTGPAERAEVWLRRGQILESARMASDLHEAVRSHGRGLEQLDAPLGAMSEAARVSATRLRVLLWMNKANALLALGHPEAATEAVGAYDAALALLEGGGGAASGSAEAGAMRGAAWLNRAAAARLSLPGAEGISDEHRCLMRATRELEAAALAGSRPARRNLAGAWLNLAANRQSAGDETEARAAWRAAVEAAAPEVRRDAVALEASLRARHAFCISQGRRLVSGHGLPEAEEAELFVIVGQGLADYAAWAGRASMVREVAARLFEFGAWHMQTRAPERLHGYLREHVDGTDPIRLAAARTSLELARQQILGSGFAELMDERGRELRVRLLELGAFAERLTEWEKVHRQNAKGA